VTTAEGERLRVASPEYRDYVEAVFRAQNRVASELAFALEDAPIPPVEPSDRALAAAESRVLAACERLNEVAARRRDEERAGLRRGIAAAREAPRCEAATRAAEAVLAGGSGP
jgi:hypothetical protein